MIDFVTCGTIIDGTGAEPRRNVVLKLEGRRIVEVEPAEALDIPPGAAHLDLSLYTVLPGLIECHDHLSQDFNGGSNPWGGSEAFLALKGAGNAEALLRAGITTCRILGEPYGIDVAWKNAIADGVIPGPRLVVAGNMIGPTGSHAFGCAVEADGIDEIEKAVRLQFKKGADLIKVMQTGPVLDVPDARFGDLVTDPHAAIRFEYAREELDVIVELSRRKGKRVAAHAHGGPGATFAIQAGCDSIEHGVFLTTDQLSMMADNGTFLVPTFGCYTTPPLDSPESQLWSHVKGVFELATDSLLEVVRKARDAGVRVATGTDTKHGDLVNEMSNLVAAGYTHMEAILAATKVGAMCCDVPAGTLETGKLADLIAVSGDPLRDLNVLCVVDIVIKEGKLEVARDGSYWPLMRTK